MLVSRCITLHKSVCMACLLPCSYNPATYMLEVSNPAAEAECGLEFADAYAASDLFHANEARVQGLSEPREGEADLKLADLAPASQLVQVGACGPGTGLPLRGAGIPPPLPQQMRLPIQ